MRIRGSAASRSSVSKSLDAAVVLCVTARTVRMFGYVDQSDVEP